MLNTQDYLRALDQIRGGLRALDNFYQEAEKSLQKERNAQDYLAQQRGRLRELERGLGKMFNQTPDLEPSELLTKCEELQVMCQEILEVPYHRVSRELAPDVILAIRALTEDRRVLGNLRRLAP